EVLVAAVLVDAALAAELGLQRFDAQAVARLAAIAAAFAHQLVDHHALGRVDQLAALAAAALLGGGGLIVDDRGGAGDLAELAVDRVELVAVVLGDAGLARRDVVLRRLVGHAHELGHALGSRAVYV